MQPHDVIEEGRFRPKNNVVRVPEGPRPGVTLCRDKLKFLHQHFLDNGVMNKYHNPADPGWYVRLAMINPPAMTGISRLDADNPACDNHVRVQSGPDVSQT